MAAKPSPKMKRPLRIGPVSARLTPTGRQSGYQVEVWHDGLNEHRVLSDRDRGVLENKLAAQRARWEEKYQARLEKEDRQARKQEGLSAAETATREAEEALQACRDLLGHTLTVDDRVDWESLKSHSPMTREPKGTPGVIYHRKTGCPQEIIEARRRRRPAATDPEFTPQFGLFDRLFSSRKRGKEEAARAALEDALNQWERDSAGVDLVRLIRQRTLQVELKEWSAEEADFKARQHAANEEVEALRNSYNQWDQSDPRPIEEHAELVLNASRYPDWIEVDYELGFTADTRTLTIEFRLPPRDSMPTLRSVSFVQSRDEFKETHIPTREQESLYESICYQIALRTIHELYEADEIAAIQAIVFNGWVDMLDTATGKRGESCIMSVQGPRDEFLALNLAEVEPRACFRSLKGVSAAKLAALTPVKPILRLDTGDRRFVESRRIAEGVSAESNLAAMDWEDFEHLVRELFGQEFVAQGGEVKVTQASRDGGVDGIAFDPDPIRGGKYVIQAKRYTRTVDVSAVRDLYGTVLHEGADRGILVTTSDYGADSVSFARDKPLTLINGAELLSLLEKHGHRARIDLAEARALQIERGR